MYLPRLVLELGKLSRDKEGCEKEMVKLKVREKVTAWVWGLAWELESGKESAWE